VADEARNNIPARGLRHCLDYAPGSLVNVAFVMMLICALVLAAMALWQPPLRSIAGCSHSSCRRDAAPAYQQVCRILQRPSA
jgi:hypothetical protein